MVSYERDTPVGGRKQPGVLHRAPRAGRFHL